MTQHNSPFGTAASIEEYNRIAALPQDRYISCAETAKLIRAELKTAFPGIKFSVTSKTYSGGASIRVKWMDGPTDEEVTAITHKFEGASFDGMQDLKTYRDTELNGEKVHFGSDYVFPDRVYSLDFLTKAAVWYCKKWGYDMPTLAVSEQSGSAYLASDYRIEARNDYFSSVFWREYRTINAKDIDTLGQEESAPIAKEPANAQESQEDTFATSAREAREAIKDDPYWNGPVPVKNFYNDTDIQDLFDLAVARAIALGRPFHRSEVFQDIWDTTGTGIVPQDDRRFVLLQEVTATTERVWGVRPDPTGFQISVDAYLEKVIVRGNLIRFFDVVNQYVNQHILVDDDMILRAACGHRYITKFVDKADLLAKRGRVCPECLAREQERVPARYPQKKEFHTMYSTNLYRLLDHPYMDIDQDTRRQIAYASPEDRATLAGTIPFFKEHMDAYFEELIQHRLLSQDITINGQSYHVVGRTPDELAQEVARMREEHTVTLPTDGQPRGQESLTCRWCGSPVPDGGQYCDEECAKWDSALPNQLHVEVTPETHTVVWGVYRVDCYGLTQEEAERHLLTTFDEYKDALTYALAQPGKAAIHFTTVKRF